MSEDQKPPGPQAPPDKAALKQAADDRRQAKRVAKEQQRLNLWRSRVHLIKEARERFAMKDFPGAVVAYEKYFRVLEIIYEAKPNEIQVSFFNNSARAKELVVIASAYWDMVRIYDQSARFHQRLTQCAEKLAMFLPFTPIYGELLRKVEDYKKSAKNKDVFDRILKQARKKKGRCFIATAAFEDPLHPTVVTLTKFRDEILITHGFGKAFIKVYYKVSPPVADILDHSELLKSVTRKSLSSVARHLTRKYNLK